MVSKNTLWRIGKLPRKGYKQAIEKIRNRHIHFMEYDAIIPSLLVELGSQAAVAKHLGVSQMTVCRAAKRVGFKFDGRKRVGIKPERIDRRRGRPAWNSGLRREGLWETVACQICGQESLQPTKKHRKFCSRKCSAIHISEMYKDGRLKGEKNPMFGNGNKIREAIKRGAYTNRKLPNHTRAKGGYYKGIWMRSSWEIEYAKLLDRGEIEWIHESKRFYFPDGTYYVPDFYIPSLNEYHEVKGHWYPGAIRKFRLMGEVYPEVKIKIVDREIWKEK